jgi:5'-phosphate synthase pdxT subunit
VNRFPPADGNTAFNELKHTINIGVLSLQGGFIEHVNLLRRLGVMTQEVRLPCHLENIDGLIIPGGESTTISKLAASAELMDPLTAFASRKAVWGTCAGMIFLAKNTGTDQSTLGIMNIEVQRNAFGRQVDSFVTELWIPELLNGDQRPFNAVFIRAPKLVSVNGQAVVVASLPDGTAVAARENQWLVTSFHPELTNDPRFHQYFLKMVQEMV